MDLRLLRRVLWRFRYLAGAGLVLAVLLSFMSYARVGFSGGHVRLTYRKGELWQGQTKLLLEQQGFPYGNADQKYTSPQVPGAPPVAVGDTTRLSQLASLYAEYVNSDEIKREVLGPPDSYLAKNASLEASAPGTAGGLGPALPVLNVTAIAPTPKLADSLAERASNAFRTYLRGSQDAAHISAQSRVLVSFLNHADKPTLVKGRKKTVPIVVFLLVVILAVGLALILENARPAPALRSVGPDVMPLPPTTERRHTSGYEARRAPDR